MIERLRQIWQAMSWKAKFAVWGVIFLIFILLIFLLFSRGGAPTPTLVPTASVVLNEVLFAPAQGQSQFIELKGVRADGSLAGFSLANEKGEKYVLPGDTPALGENAYLLIVFDGGNRLDGFTLHADRRAFLNTSSGFVEINAQDGQVLDRVAWGKEAGAVNMGRGGAHDDFTAGTSIGRFPLSTSRNNPLEWLTYFTEEVTPGAPNTNPRVEMLLPLQGAYFSQPSVELSWYPVAGAASYRVELAGDAEFDSIITENSVPSPLFKTPDLGAGGYFWRVQAIFEDGSSAGFSEASSFVIGTTELPNFPGQQSSALFPSAFAVETVPPLREGVLPVPMIYQHKDTAMLLLESNMESGAHAWDRDHGTLDQSDPADNMNCALASTAMVNNFAGGNLSQDRIGYEIRKDVFPNNPIWDLNYGSGLLLDEINDALSFAFNGAAVTRHTPTTADAFWATVTQEIDAGRPIVTRVVNAAGGGHAIVISGYYQFAHTGPNARWVTINDPWSGRYLVNLSRMNRATHYWLLSDISSPRNDEAEIKQDSDGDGMVDFDETERFKTDQNNKDSDQDKVEDKIEVYTTVFDPNYGHAIIGVSIGRDWDSDRKAMELDEDSDGGGCKDGEEDENFNGKRDGGETYNFDESDDECKPVGLGGRVTMSYGYVPSYAPPCKGRVDVRVRFKLEPRWGDVPEEFRPPVASAYNAKEVFYEVSADGCEDLLDAAFDGWGGANVACNAPGDKKSGVVSIGPENTSSILFLPLDPSLSILLPESAWITLPIECVYVDGSIFNTSALFLGSDPLNIGSGKNCETSEQYEFGHPPSRLDFCVEPNVCNSAEFDRTDPETFAACYTRPERYATIPFGGTLSKRGEEIVTDGDSRNPPTTQKIDDIQVSWEICDGCGDEFPE